MMVGSARVAREAAAEAVSEAGWSELHIVDGDSSRIALRVKGQARDTRRIYKSETSFKWDSVRISGYCK